jgi:acetyl esterase/lipase
MFSAWLLTILGRLRGRPRYPTWPFVFELLVRYLRLDWDETATWDDAKLRADLNARPLSDPRISPTNANLRGLAPCFLTVGELEIPRDDIVEFAKRLRNAGVDVNLHVAQSTPHNAPVFADYHPEAKKAFNALVQFIQAHLD